MAGSLPLVPPSRLQEWILFWLIQREANGQKTTGKDVFWASDVESLLAFEMITLEQTHVVPSLQDKIMQTTEIHLTDKGRHYFER